MQRRQDRGAGELVLRLHAVQVASHDVGAEGGARRAPHSQLERVLRVVLVLVQDHLGLKRRQGVSWWRVKCVDGAGDAWRLAAPASRGALLRGYIEKTLLPQ